VNHKRKFNSKPTTEKDKVEEMEELFCFQLAIAEKYEEACIYLETWRRKI
jgi:hypothetical protein